MEKTCDNCDQNQTSSFCIQWLSEAIGWAWMSKSNLDICQSWKEKKNIINRKEELIKRWLAYKENIINDMSDYSENDMFIEDNEDVTEDEFEYLLGLALTVTLRKRNEND